MNNKRFAQTHKLEIGEASKADQLLALITAALSKTNDFNVVKELRKLSAQLKNDKNPSRKLLTSVAMKLDRIRGMQK